MVATKRLEVWREIADKDFASAFHLLLGRLVHAIARLDFGIGLQLRYWGNEQDPKIQVLLEPLSAKLNGRLKALESLMRTAWDRPNAEGGRELAHWFEEAHKARAFRNDYAHGRWGLPGKHLHTESGRLSDATPLVVFIPLDWDMSPNRQDNTVDFTLEEFAEQVQEAELLSGQFLSLVEKYGAHLHIGQNLSARPS